MKTISSEPDYLLIVKERYKNSLAFTSSDLTLLAISEKLKHDVTPEEIASHLGILPIRPNGIEWLRIEIAPPSAHAPRTKHRLDEDKEGRIYGSIDGHKVFRRVARSEVGNEPERDLPPDHDWESEDQFIERVKAEAERAARDFYRNLSRARKIMPAPDRWVHWSRDGATTEDIRRRDPEADRLTRQGVDKAKSKRAKELRLALPIKRN